MDRINAPTTVTITSQQKQQKQEQEQQRLLVERIAKELMQDHGLTSEGWHFQWSRGKCIAGLCSYSRKTVFLSMHMVCSPKVKIDDIRNTLLHEIAHALTPGAGHNQVWRQKAIDIGCDGSRCHDFGSLAEPAFTYTCTCGACTGKVHKRTARLRRSTCRVCNSPLRFARAAGTSQL